MKEIFLEIYNADFKDRLRQILSQRTKVAYHEKNRSPSAVLIPIYYHQRENYIIFTKRTELVRHHKGEISFPGGGFHADDGSLLNTALRESFEEIGLHPEDVEVLGELDDVPTRTSNYIITPFIGSIAPDYKFKLSSFETAEILQIPISTLAQKGCRQEVPVIDPHSASAAPFVYTYQRHRITGATARILKQFLEIVCQG